MAANCKSAKYYRKNPKARKKKAATDKKINSRKSQIKKRVEANRKRIYLRVNIMQIIKTMIVYPLF